MEFSAQRFQQKNYFCKCLVYFIKMHSHLFFPGVCISIAGQRKIIRLVKEMIPILVQIQRA